LTKGTAAKKQWRVFPGSFQSFIQFVAARAGQAGDFAIAGVHNLEGVCCGFETSVFRHGFIEPIIRLYHSIQLHQNNNYFKLFL
jgi:hypothetical protein